MQLSQGSKSLLNDLVKKAFTAEVMLPDFQRNFVWARQDVEELIKGMPRVRGIVPGTISIEEIEPLLTPKKIIENIEKGDVVEIIAGPFKGERAKVIRVDKNKEEVT